MSAIDLYNLFMVQKGYAAELKVENIKAKIAKYGKKNPTGSKLAKNFNKYPKNSWRFNAGARGF